LKTALISELFPGPLDIVGDIHGEIDALQDLLRHLGYETDGIHPQGRRLVFIGDLTDRGPDSPALIRLVSGLVSRGLAQCVLGNHELNLLRQAPKEGNGWFFEENHDHRMGKFRESRAVTADSRSGVREFLTRLPLALERDDLRLVHAAWHDASIAEIRSSTGSVLELYENYHARAICVGEDTGLAERAKAEMKQWANGLSNRDVAVLMLPAVAALDALYQDANPVRIVTSGLERIAETPFFASGKWRMVRRSPWWDEYREDIPVIVGHYWRWPTAPSRDALSKGEPDLFQGLMPQAWFGAKRNVFCVDFAVGARYKERETGAAQFECRLGAVQWPEGQLVFDDGRIFKLARQSAAASEAHVWTGIKSSYSSSFE
jgi:Calcineurin-like phosphoesterase